jgi:hypothetical protein
MQAAAKTTCLAARLSYVDITCYVSDSKSGMLYSSKFARQLSSLNTLCLGHLLSLKTYSDFG